MADGAALALQKAVVGALKSDAALFTLVGSRVYDEPPQGVSRPYVRIGTMETRPSRTSCGTDYDLDYSVECHSRPEGAGRVEAQRVADAVLAALDGASLTVTGFTACWNDFSAMSVIRDTDGRSYVATVVFEAALDV